MDKDRADVFISYRRADRDTADRLYDLLKARHVTAWYDPLIAPGTDWRDAIVERLSEARLMVILLSSTALESDELKKELAVADQEDVPLLAVRLEDVKPRQAFAYELARSNWFDVFDDPGARLPQLADFLKELVRNPSQIPTTLGASLQARRERRRRELFGLFSLLRNNTALLMLLIVVSAGQFLLYERAAAPMQQLTGAGVGQLTAFFYVLFVVTIGSPFILFSLLRGGLVGEDLPLLAAASANTLILILLVRNFFLWIQRRTVRGRRG